MIIVKQSPSPKSTLNFSDTSRGPTTKCYTFLETSHDPWLRSQLRCKNFANFFATLFCKPTKLTLPEVLPPSVIPFWKPLITPDLHLTLFPHHEVISTFIQEESFGEVCVFQGEDKSSHPRFSLDTVDSRLVVTIVSKVAKCLFIIKINNI